MKQISIIALIIALSNAFVTAEDFASCKELDISVYGKINPAGNDINPENFIDVTTFTDWTCVPDTFSHCLYYFDKAHRQF